VHGGGRGHLRGLGVRYLRRRRGLEWAVGAATGSCCAARARARARAPARARARATAELKPKPKSKPTPGPEPAVAPKLTWREKREAKAAQEALAATAGGTATAGSTGAANEPKKKTWREKQDEEKASREKAGSGRKAKAGGGQTPKAAEDAPRPKLRRPSLAQLDSMPKLTDRFKELGPSPGEEAPAANPKPRVVAQWPPPCDGGNGGNDAGGNGGKK
jgi:translation initiation factor IF-2